MCLVLDDLDQAELFYRRAIEYAPHQEEAHINLAQLLVRREDTAAGMAEFERALKANRHSRIALANLGATAFNEGRHDRALSLYRRALDVDPDYALVHKHIASVYALRDTPAKAAHHARRSLDLDPNQPDAEALQALLSQAETEVTRRAGSDGSTPER